MANAPSPVLMRRPLLFAVALLFGLYNAAVLVYDVYYFRSVIMQPEIVTSMSLLIGFECAIGFAFAALRLRTSVVWPLILATAINKIVFTITKGHVFPNSYADELLILTEIALAVILWPHCHASTSNGSPKPWG